MESRTSLSTHTHSRTCTGNADVIWCGGHANFAKLLYESHLHGRCVSKASEQTTEPNWANRAGKRQGVRRLMNEYYKLNAVGVLLHHLNALYISVIAFRKDDLTTNYRAIKQIWHSVSWLNKNHVGCFYLDFFYRFVQRFIFVSVFFLLTWTLSLSSSSVFFSVVFVARSNVIYAKNDMRDRCWSSTVLLHTIIVSFTDFLLRSSVVDVVVDMNALRFVFFRIIIFIHFMSIDN